MAKRRSIDGKIRSSQTFAKLTYRQRDLWQGLIQVVDDQGRMPGDPRFVRSQVWAYDDISTEEVMNDLRALEKSGNILIYEVDDCTYIQIIKWHYYQRDAEWLGLSDYPAPEGWQDYARYHGKGNKIILHNWDKRNKLPSELPSELPRTLPCRDVNDDEKGSGDVNDEEYTTPPGGGECEGVITRTDAEKKGDVIDGILAYQQPENDVGWCDEYLRPLAKVFLEYSGMRFEKKKKRFWIDKLRSVFLDGITPDDYHAAIEYMHENGLTISSPESPRNIARSKPWLKGVAKKKIYIDAYGNEVLL